MLIIKVTQFDKISESLKEKQAEYVKAKKFQQMRKRLNKELAVQTNIQAVYVFYYARFNLTVRNKTTGSNKDEAAPAVGNTQALENMFSERANDDFMDQVDDMEEALTRAQEQLLYSRDRSICEFLSIDECE